MLVVAGLSATTRHDVVLCDRDACRSGSMLGDHVLYAAGRRGGVRLLALYWPSCHGRLHALRRDGPCGASKRFGPVALLMARISTSVRLFAAICAGSGQISYWRFVALDAVGTVIYTTLWVGLGALFGPAVLERTGPFMRVLLLLLPTALFVVLGYRLLRRPTLRPRLARSGLVTTDRGPGAGHRFGYARGNGARTMAQVTRRDMIRWLETHGFVHRSREGHRTSALRPRREDHAARARASGSDEEARGPDHSRAGARRIRSRADPARARACSRPRMPACRGLGASADRRTPQLER